MYVEIKAQRSVQNLDFTPVSYLRCILFAALLGGAGYNYDFPQKFQTNYCIQSWNRRFSVPFCKSPHILSCTAIQSGQNTTKPMLRLGNF